MLSLLGLGMQSATATTSARKGLLAATIDGPVTDLIGLAADSSRFIGD
jgi:hypothetical protein